jgi:hypothetical protein
MMMGMGSGRSKCFFVFVFVFVWVWCQVVDEICFVTAWCAAVCCGTTTIPTASSILAVFGKEKMMMMENARIGFFCLVVAGG